MAGAFAWGLLAASSLVLGAAISLRVRIGLRTIGLIMRFGAGVLISAVAFDLVGEPSLAPRGTARSFWGCSRAAASSSEAIG
jgi:ZIP family zinc transporter